MSAQKSGVPPRRLVLSVIALIFILTPSACAKEPPVPKIELDQSVGIYQLMPEHGTLTIAITYFTENDENTLLRETRAIFMDKYPGWKVEIIPESEWTSAADAEERYFDELPGRLRGADGPDIVSLWNADRERLINEHLLQDLMPMVDSDGEFDLDRILPGVRNALSDEQGALYYMPMSFTFWVLNINTRVYAMEFSADVIAGRIHTERPSPWTWKNAAEFFKPELERIGQQYLLPYTPQEFAWYLLRDYLHVIYDAETDVYDFDHPAFGEIMTTAYDLYKEGLLTDAESAANPAGGLPAKGLLYFNLFMDSEITDYTQFISNSRNIYAPMPEIESAEGFSLVSMIDEYAINANAPERTAAWEFLKIMWSEEVQNSVDLTYQPILSELNAEHIQRVLGISPAADGYADDIRAFNNERYLFFSKINRVYAARLPRVDYDVFSRYAKGFFLDELSLDDLIRQLRRTAERE